MTEDRKGPKGTERPEYQSTSGHPLEERPLPPTVPPNPATPDEVAYQETHTDALGSGQHAIGHVPAPPEVPRATVDDSAEAKPKLDQPPAGR